MRRNGLCVDLFATDTKRKTILKIDTMNENDEFAMHTNYNSKSMLLVSLPFPGQ